MARRCALTNRGVQFGHRVSHSNRKTNRKFLPNLQEVSLLSDALGHEVSLRVCARTLRTIEHNGGLDAYLLSTPMAKLPEQALRLRQRIRRALSNRTLH